MQYTIQRFSIDYGEVVEQYKQPSKYWPKPIVDPSVQWKELEAIEQDSNYYETQELPEVVLGKKLFSILNYQLPVRYPAAAAIILNWDGQIVRK